MSTLALAPPAPDRVGAQRTLDDVLVGVWSALGAGRTVACPVCRGEMEASRRTPAPAAGGGPALLAAGRCTACGSELS